MSPTGQPSAMSAGDVGNGRLRGREGLSMRGFCSVRLIQPFCRRASTEESLRDLIVPEVRTMDLDARVPLRASHGAVAVASERIADPSLGLRLGHDFYF